MLVDDAEHLRRLSGKRVTTEVEGAIQDLLEDPTSHLVDLIGDHLATVM